jgi:DNA invertase Pin-like site-specific DNA recombinase
VTVPHADTPGAPGSLLAPEPAVRTGALIGYARVSTSGQLLDRQQHALAEAGCIRVFADKLSGKNSDRPELAACLDYLRPGDTLVVPSLDRLSRSLADLIQIVGTLRRQGVGFKSLHEALDTTTPGGRLVFHVFAALAEFIRELIVEGTREGLDAARARGQRLGRPPAMTAEQIRHARDLLTRPDNTVSSIARLLGVSRATIYKYVPDLPPGPGQLRPRPAGRSNGREQRARRVPASTGPAQLTIWHAGQIAYADGHTKPAANASQRTPFSAENSVP